MPPYAESIGVGISIAGVIWVAGRNLLTKRHLYRDDGSPIYARADACQANSKETAAGLARVLDEMGELKKNQAVMNNEMKHLRRDLNGRVGEG